MLTTTSHIQEDPLEIPAQPTTPPSGWGEFIGVALTVVIVVGREILKRQTSSKKEEEDAQKELTHFLKIEIEKRDRMIAQLTNQIQLMRRSLDFSGDFSPPVTNQRIEEVKNNADSSLHY